MSEDRITELEMKIAFQEDTINQLDAVVCRQQTQIDGLIKQYKKLMNHAQEASKDTISTQRIEDDIPPHY